MFSSASELDSSTVRLFKAWQTPGLELGIRVSNASFASRDVRWEDKDRSEKGAKWPSVWCFWMVLVISGTEIIHVGVQVESFRIESYTKKIKEIHLNRGF